MKLSHGRRYTPVELCSPEWAHHLFDFSRLFDIWLDLPAGEDHEQYPECIQQCIQ